MLTYAISLEKGGTGKSSIAVNLAAAFQQRGLRTGMLRAGLASIWHLYGPRTAFWGLFGAVRSKPAP